METIKNNIVQALKNQGRTQRQLAADLGITVQNLQYYYKGNITTRNLERIAAALDVDPWQLLRPAGLDDDETQTRTEPNQPTDNRRKLQTICPHCKKPITITIQ